MNLGEGGSFTLDLSYGLWPGAGGGGGGGGTPPDPSLTLSAAGYKVKGNHKVDLSWSGANGSNVDVYRNGILIVPPTGNDGFYTDNIDNKGGATYTHKVCEAGTATCSNVTTTVF